MYRKKKIDANAGGLADMVYWRGGTRGLKQFSVISYQISAIRNQEFGGCWTAEIAGRGQRRCAIFKLPLAVG